MIFVSLIVELQVTAKLDNGGGRNRTVRLIRLAWDAWQASGWSLNSDMLRGVVDDIKKQITLCHNFFQMKPEINLINDT